MIDEEYDAASFAAAEDIIWYIDERDETTVVAMTTMTTSRNNKIK